jgi:hypothetical protein
LSKIGAQPKRHISIFTEEGPVPPPMGSKIITEAYTHE